MAHHACVARDVLTALYILQSHLYSVPLVTQQ